jgi:tetratricopeptide (TPR) repeat protein
MRDLIRKIARVNPRVAAAAAIAALSAWCLAQPAEAGDAPAVYAESQLLKQLYLNGVARMAQGDPARAVPAFQLVSEVAPELAQAHYALGLAMVLADFAHRERALPEFDKAVAGNQPHPLFTIARVIADPTLSALHSDGALYLTPDGAGRMRSAAGRLADASDGYNGRYLEPILAEVEATGDATHPFRLPHFAAMLGKDGSVQLRRLGNTTQPFGRLFAIAVPDARFQAYEARAVAHLENGLDSLRAENIEAVQGKSREDALRQRIRATPQS